MRSATLLILFLASWGGIRAVEACPFCGWLGTRPPPVQKTLAESRSAVLARLIPPVPDDAELLRLMEAEEPWTARFAVTKQLKGAADLEPGQVLGQTVHGLVPEEEAAYLLTRTEDAPDEEPWRIRRFTRRGARLLPEILRLPEVTKEDPDALRARLTFFLPRLNDEDAAIAEAAYYEFTQAAYADLQRIRDRIDPDLIVLWLENPTVYSNRGLLYLLLGLSAREPHRQKMKTWLERPEWEWSGLDGLIGGYLLLGGEEALGQVRRQLAEDENRARARHVARSLITALRFHEEEEHVLERAAIREAVVEMLGNPRVADLAVRELQRREDWKSLPRVALLQRDHGDASPRIAGAVRVYLRACPQPEAKALLEKLEADRVTPR